MQDLNMRSNLSRWLYYLKNEGKDEEDEYLNILLKDDPDIQKAHEKYHAFTRDKELIEAYEAHMKWKRDYNTGIAAARREGVKEGHEKGVEEGLEKGRAEIKAMLLEAIELKFGTITEEVREKIDATESSERMSSFLKEILTAKSLEEFCTLLDK